MAERTLARPAARPAAPTRVARRGFRWDRVVLYVVLTLLALFFVLPIIWMVSTSLKPGQEAIIDFGWIPRNPSLQNFEDILGAQFPVVGWFINSVLTATIGTAFILVLSSLSGYAFARMDFPGKNALFTLLITTLLLPGVMFLVPQFLVVLKFGDIPVLGQFFGLATIGAYMLPALAGVFGVFFMRQFFLGIPLELEEAAYVDGANRLRTFASIVVPLAGPALATLGIISFLALWNDYLWPLTQCSAALEACTLQPGLAQFQGENTYEYGLLMAGTVIAAVAVLIFYVIAQRWIIQSVASSGVKG